MTTPRPEWKKEAMTILAGLSAVAAIHAGVVVPGILFAAKADARAIMAEHMKEVEIIRSKYVTHEELDQVIRSLEHVQEQLSDLSAFLRQK